MKYCGYSLKDQNHCSHWTKYVVKAIFFNNVWYSNTVNNYTVSQKKDDTDVAHYNLNAHQPILASFGVDVAEGVCYQMVICYPTYPS